MGLLVLSDIHGHETVLHNILRCETAGASRVDTVVFLGDGLREMESLSYSADFYTLPVVCVRGNCDFFSAEDTPELREATWSGYRVMMMHRHRFDVKSGMARAVSFCAGKGGDLLLFGHTHIPTEKRLSAGETVGSFTLEKPLILFNPGSVGGGHYGVITLSENGIVCEHKQK